MARAGFLPTPDEVMAGPDKGPTPVAPQYAVSRQDQLDMDRVNGPGFTIDDQKPGFWSNTLGAPGRGLGQAGADVYGMLAHGASMLFEPIDAPIPVGDGTVVDSATSPKDHPWTPAADALEQQSVAAHEWSKSLTPDPRITGAGANLVQGLTKGVGEFVGGSVVGGPLAGAATLGTAEARASYLDLLDQGVDHDTALKSAAITGTLSAGAAFLPMALPAKALAKLSTPAALLAQAGVGATVNTSFGVGQRYASAKILEDAGYKAQAEQIKPWDSMNLAVDFLSGAVFGVHQGWHGIRAERNDAQVADAARAVQDRQATLDRAPGVPVDTASMATHREALESALSDLMQNKPVDLADQAENGGLFARPEEDTAQAREIIRQQFLESGVLGDAEALDRWFRGEPEPEAETKPAAPPADFNDEIPPVSEPAAKPTETAQEPSVSQPAGGKPVHEMSSDELHAAADKADAADVSTLTGAFGDEETARRFQKLASSDSDSAYERGEKMLEKLTPEQRAIVDRWETEAGGGRDMRDLAKRMEDIAGAETPEDMAFQLRRDLTDVGTKKNPAEMNPKELTAYMRLKTAMETAQEKGWNTAEIGHAAIQESARRFSDPADALFMLNRFLKPEFREGGAGEVAPGPDVTPPLRDRPNLELVDAAGDRRPALMTYDSALADEADAAKNAEPMHRAAVECEARHA